ncbi:MAG: porin [Aquabacterium sp.]|nr:MAG: porin [Aquabacterium sp.]
MSLKKKRSLVAIAATSLLAASAAHAQNTLNIYGIIDLAFGSYDYSGDTAKRISAVQSGQMTTSYIGFRGEEDLGGGLKAVFKLESFYRADTGASGRFGADTMWSRNAYVGLTGGFGSVIVGRFDNQLYQQALAFNPYGGSFGWSPTIRLTFGQFGNVRGDSGWSNTLNYITPNLGGFTGVVQVQAKEADNNGGGVSLSGKYLAGPFGIGFGWQQLKAGIADGKQTTWLLGTSYDFGVLKAFGQVGRIDDSDDVPSGMDTTLWQLGLSVPLSTSGSILASYGQTKEDPAASAVDTKHQILTLGYDHFLSKRTDVYVNAMYDKEERQDSKGSIGVGIRHRF